MHCAKNAGQPGQGREAVRMTLQRQDKALPMGHIVVLLLAATLLALTAAAAAFGQDYPTEAEIENMLLPRARMNRGIGGVVSDEPSVTLRIHFRRNSAELTPAAKPPLDNLGLALQQEKLRGYIFKIEGHTCDLGSEAYNRALSLERAKAVRDYLVRNFSLSGSQLEVDGFGERHPAVPNTDEAARKKNRRVVIKNTLRGFDPLKAGSSVVTARIKCLRNRQEEVVLKGDTLTSSDLFSVEFITRESMYLYVFHVESDGKMTRIYPNDYFSSQGNPVAPNRVYRIPEERKWLQLDENKGVEHIVLLADAHALDDPEAVCRQVMPASAPRPGGMKIVEIPTGEETRGIMGIRKELRYERKSLFVWKSYFIHQ